MYDELIKRLREFASIPEHCENVASCDQCSKESICLSFTNKRIIEVATQAADAIEELSKPRWISVEEALPEDGEEVLCYYEYFRYGRFNGMYKTVDRGYFFNGHFGGEPTKGRKAKVLYWMPLPEPPKEET